MCIRASYTATSYDVRLTAVIVVRCIIISRNDCISTTSYKNNLFSLIDQLRYLGSDKSVKLDTLLEIIE